MHGDGLITAPPGRDGVDDFLSGLLRIAEDIKAQRFVTGLTWAIAWSTESTAKIGRIGPKISLAHQRLVDIRVDHHGRFDSEGRVVSAAAGGDLFPCWPQVGDQPLELALVHDALLRWLPSFKSRSDAAIFATRASLTERSTRM